jgi:hypothetical protein
MSQLEWIRTADGYESGCYRISQSGNNNLPWKLEVLDPGASLLACRIQAVSTHLTLREAKNCARRTESNRIWRLRMMAHVTVAGAAFGAIVAVATFTDLPMFLAVVALLHVALGSLADLAWIWLNDAWGSTRSGGGPPPMSWSDRAILAVVKLYQARQAAAVSTKPRVILLPPPSTSPSGSSAGQTRQLSHAWAAPARYHRTDTRLSSSRPPGGNAARYLGVAKQLQQIAPPKNEVLAAKRS